jgi:hypothetical protein
MQILGKDQITWKIITKRIQMKDLETMSKIKTYLIKSKSDQKSNKSILKLGNLSA